MLEAYDIRSYAKSLTPRVEPRGSQLDAPVILNLRTKGKERGVNVDSSKIRNQNRKMYIKIPLLMLLKLSVPVRRLRIILFSLHCVGYYVKSVGR